MLISLFIVFWNYLIISDQSNYLNLKNIYNFSCKKILLKKQSEIRFVAYTMNFVKILLKKNQFIDAEKIIINSLKKIKEDNIKNILYLRLAKIYSYHKKIEKTIKTLNKVKSHAWWILKYDILGDLLFDKKNKKISLLFFNKSLSYLEDSSLKEMIKIKINDLNQS